MNVSKTELNSCTETMGGGFAESLSDGGSTLSTSVSLGFVSLSGSVSGSSFVMVIGAVTGADVKGAPVGVAVGTEAVCLSEMHYDNEEKQGGKR